MTEEKADPEPFARLTGGDPGLSKGFWAPEREQVERCGPTRAAATDPQQGGAWWVGSQSLSGDRSSDGVQRQNLTHFGRAERAIALAGSYHTRFKQSARIIPSALASHLSSDRLPLSALSLGSVRVWLAGWVMQSAAIWLGCSGSSLWRNWVSSMTPRETCPSMTQASTSAASGLRIDAQMAGRMDGAIAGRVRLICL